MSPRNKTDGTPTGMALKSLRESVGVSQAELATRCGYSVKTIHRWESGVGQPRRAVMECLNVLAQLPVEDPDGEPTFRFIDLFAGIGGLRLAFEGIGGSCVFTSEWDKYAQATYKANFRISHPIAGDIVQIASDAIPEHDVLLAGFPCQPFSLAGVSKKNALGRPHGFACDTQGTLFFELARILKHHRPKAFLLENVKNLASHDSGKTFRVIRQVLTEELGYTVHWKVLDASCVVPQHRERIFIVGFREDNCFSWDDLELPRAAAWPRLKAILHSQTETDIELPFTDEKGRVARKYYLTKHLWEYLKTYALKHRDKGNGFGFGLVGPDDIARTLSARYYKDGSEILVRTGRRTPRRLTPRECARLMGFDRPNKPRFKIPVSDTQAYKQFGNSVVVPLVEAVARAMKPYLTGEGTERTRQLSLPLSVSA